MELLGIEKTLQTFKNEGERNFFSTYSTLKERLFTYEYTQTSAEFPGGNDHGPNHIRRVLKRLDDILGRTPLEHVNVFELWLAMMAVLYHDVGLLQTRDKHPEVGADLMLGEQNPYLFDKRERELIHAAIFTHGSKTDIDQKCRKYPKRHQVGDFPVNVRLVCALVRLADELDEDYRRGDEGLFKKRDIEKRYPDSVQYWRFNQRIPSVQMDSPGSERREIEIQIQFEVEDVSFDAKNKKGEPVPFIEFAIDKVLKINAECHYCNRFFPPTLRFSDLRLTVLPGQSSTRETSKEILISERTQLAEVMAQLPDELKRPTTAHRSGSAAGPRAPSLPSTSLLPPEEPRLGAASPLPGWTLVDDAFLAGYRRPRSNDELRKYFDGRIPNWADATTPRIRRLHWVDESTNHLREAQRANAVPQMYLLLGAGGEGKSTIVRQVAVDLAAADENRNVLWRETGATLDSAALEALPRGERRWLLVADDADAIVQDLVRAVRVLQESARADLDLLLCARDTDWEAAGGFRQQWDSYVEYKLVRVRGLALSDAKSIVEAWTELGDVGLGRLAAYRAKERVPRLVAAAKEESSQEDGVFLGAMLRTRYGQTAREHVKLVMEHLSRYSLSSGKSLLNAFLHVAAAHAANQLSLGPELLAEAIGLPPGNLFREVIAPLGEEATAEHLGEFLRVRHRAIAEAAVAQAAVFREDLPQIYSALIGAASARRERRLYVADYDKFIYVSIQFAREVERRTKDPRQPGTFGYLDLETLVKLARTTARAAVRPEPNDLPDNLRRLINLCSVLRAIGQGGESLHILRDALPRIMSMRDYPTAARGFFTEWAMVAGDHGGSAELSLWLLGLALSDDITAPIEEKDAAPLLASMGVLLQRLLTHSPQPAYADGMGAVLALGPRASLGESHERVFKNHEAFGKKHGVMKPGPQEALPRLHKAIVAAANASSGAQVPTSLPPAPSIRFSQLARLLGVKPPRT
ncbi:HD domain-containing protein [Polyangium sp. y55x31]|uniref:P-loop NTPase n=1 Tax=Polyangium sp. y55x31 TaxID=3042688 RepID=UPI00248296E0|nr:HD domain-containing protein [Polyangium sp. y55x31]MDI1480411.1 HD domain-containing protein [Polyangium sp. y55x31]